MALSIKDDKLERKIRFLAERKKTTMTGALRLVIDAAVEQEHRFSPEEIARRTAALDRLRLSVDRDKLDWSKTDDEIMGYDEFGLPN